MENTAKSKESNEYASNQIKSPYSDLEENQNHISKFLRVISKGIDRHGIKKITSILVGMDIHTEFENKGTTDLVQFICNEVVINYNKNREDKISVEDLFKKEKRGDCTLARKMAIILLKQHVKITPTKLGDFFGRSRQVIHTAVEEFKSLNIKLVQDLDFMNRHDDISQKVILYMEQNGLSSKK
jgi:chromosomal replication initiation ATPase DnaA